MGVIKKEELVEKVISNYNIPISKKEIKEICDCFMKEVFACFENEQSIQYGDYPLFRCKLSQAKYNETSPRTPRRERIIVTLKFPVTK